MNTETSPLKSQAYVSCCARAVAGQAPTTLPSRVMNRVKASISTAPRRSFACARGVLLLRSVWSSKVKIADDLGVAVPELEYVQAIRHDASWVGGTEGE